MWHNFLKSVRCSEAPIFERSRFSKMGLQSLSRVTLPQARYPDSWVHHQWDPPTVWPCVLCYSTHSCCFLPFLANPPWHWSLLPAFSPAGPYPLAALTSGYPSSGSPVLVLVHLCTDVLSSLSFGHGWWCLWIARSSVCACEPSAGLWSLLSLWVCCPFYNNKHKLIQGLWGSSFGEW